MNVSSIISFPGLGIGEFKLDRTAFTVFGRDIAWYGIIITLGIFAAIGYVIFRARQYQGISSDDVIDFAFFVVISGIIGARLYYVLTTMDNYNSLFDVIAIWEGGLGIYGGIIAGGLAAYCVCRYKKINFWSFFDFLAPSVMLGQIFGRWGNFCNGEAFGTQTSNFLRMSLTHVYSNGSTHYLGTVHPTFLYESMWNLLGFVLLNIFYKKRRFNGQIFLGYVGWYGFGRMFIELLRTDSLYVGPFRISVVVGLLSFVGASILMIYMWNRGKRSDSVRTGTDSDAAIENKTA